MFIEKSKKALTKTDAHTGERDYLHVAKDDTGLDIKVPSGKTKLKITKGFGASGEISQVFDVVGSGDAVGVEGMNKIVVGNAFADDYCEAYSGYLTYDDGAECAPKLAGAVDGVVVYRTPCQKEFFEFELSVNQKIELFVEDVVLIEKTYSATLKQNLSVKETLGLKAFEDYFGTGVILNELHEADRVFFADGLPIEVDLNETISIWAGTTDESIKSTYGMAFIDCAYTKNEESKYVAIRRRMYFYFVEDEAITANYEYAFNNFTPQKDIYFLFEFGKYWMQTIFGFEREGGTERLWLFMENHNAELTKFEDMSMSFLYAFKTYVVNGNLTFDNITRVTNGNYEWTIHDQRLDFYPTFYVPNSSIFDFTNPRSDKWVKTQYKFLDVIQGLGLYPVINRWDGNRFSNIVNARGEIYNSSLGGWNNKKMLSLLDSNPNVPKIKTCSNGGSHIWLVYAGYGSRSDYLSTLDKNYIPLPRWGYTRYFKYADIYGQVKFIYDKALMCLSVMADCSTSDNVILTQRVIAFVREHIGDVDSLKLPHTVVTKKNLDGTSLSTLFISEVVDSFMEVSPENKFSFFGIADNVVLGHPFPYAYYSQDIAQRIKFFIAFANAKGIVLRAENDTISWDGSSDIKYLYAYLDSKDFVLKSLFLKNYEREVGYPTYSYSYDYDYSHLWTTYADGHFSVREIINDGSNAKVPASLKNFLEEVLIPKLDTAYENLLHVKILVTNNGSELHVPLSTAQIQGLLRGLFNQFLLKGTMNISFRATISYTGLNPYDGKLYPDGIAFNFSGVDALASVSVNATINYGGDVVENHVSGVESASDDAVEPSEPPLDKVSITVTDSGKTRTIGYASPIAIESISIGGQRIDAVNQKLKDGTLRKFSVGSSTVTWGGNMITIYNFSTVTSLKIGDASFVF